MLDVGCRANSEDICVGLRVIEGVGIRAIVGVYVDAQQAWCGCYGKLERFVHYF
jgi:hypothetical protein